MQALTYALNIGTLATWLSVGVFGTVGVIIPGWAEVFPPKLPQQSETMSVSPEIILGEAAAEEPESARSEAVEALAPPPELPEIAELPPLPVVPDLPQPPAPRVERVPRSAIAPAHPSAPTSAPVSAARRVPERVGNGKPAAKLTAKPAAKPAARAMSSAERLAAGQMRPPSYPSYSRRNNQTGKVMIDFTVDASGRVSAARVISSSGWPLLDAEAVQTVKSWKFPPGGTMKLQRPIVFRLK